MADSVLVHPNRDKAESKATRAVVILLLVTSAALILIVTIGGWDAIEGAKPVQLVYIAIYVVMALFVARWARGVLPMIAGLAVILAGTALVVLADRGQTVEPAAID